jgi:hypothetical protein
MSWRPWVWKHRKSRTCMWSRMSETEANNPKRSRFSIKLKQVPRDPGTVDSRCVWSVIWNSRCWIGAFPWESAENGTS